MYRITFVSYRNFDTKNRFSVKVQIQHIVQGNCEESGTLCQFSLVGGFEILWVHNFKKSGCFFQIMLKDICRSMKVTIYGFHK